MAAISDGRIGEEQTYGAFDFLRVGRNLCICTHQGFLEYLSLCVSMYFFCVCVYVLKQNPQKQHIEIIINL